MNAQIIFTYPVDSIDKECKKMLKDINSRLRILIGNLKVATDKTDLQLIMQDVENARRDLILVDTNLEEVYNILLGLVNYDSSQDGEEYTEEEEDAD